MFYLIVANVKDIFVNDQSRIVWQLFYMQSAFITFLLVTTKTKLNESVTKLLNKILANDKDM